jgi:tetratricopeptide (TPR) repeat protein
MAEPSPVAEAQAARTAAEQAEEAEAATLWDVAAERYEACLSLVGGTPAASTEADLLTALGRCYWNLSDARTAWRTLRRAIGLYRDRGDGVGMARATLEILRIWGPPDRQMSMAEDALEALGDRDAHLRALLLLRAHREDEALALARQHAFDDVLIVESEREAYAAYDAGRVVEANAALRRAHELHAELRNYHAAAGVLRYAGFETMAMGFLDDGEQFSAETVAYTRTVHLRFTEQLALMDLVGVAFARCDFESCETLIAERPAETDFRGDLYRMWIAELRGDMASALALIVDPERGGGATTALSQTHAAAAGLLHDAGRHDAARQELQVWASIAREGRSFCDEAPALADCLIALGSEALIAEIHDQFETRKAPVVYSTLQGRGESYVRGAIALQLGRRDRARDLLSAGLAWADRERCPIDAGRCLQGLASVAAAADDGASASAHLDRAAAIFQRHEATLYLDQIGAARRSWSAPR